MQTAAEFIQHCLRRQALSAGAALIDDESPAEAFQVSGVQCF